MKIYLTDESKQELEIELIKIDLEIQQQKSFEFPIDYLLGELEGKKTIIQSILSSATILPVEESWRKCGVVNREDREYVTHEYPKGVIIQSKL
jgi:hypothetical protein